MKAKIQTLLESLKKQLPGVSAKIDPPADPKGHWFMDLEFQGHKVVVEYRPKHGFGVSSAVENEYGEGPEEVFTTPKDAILRIIQLLQTRTRTVPPDTVVLRELRQLSKLTQEEIAERLGIAQGAVSRMERRRDMSISTLRRLVGAMGGELDLVVRFPSRTVHIGQFEGEHDGTYEKAACAHSTVEHASIKSPLPTGAPSAHKLESELNSWLETLRKSLPAELPLHVKIRTADGILDGICRSNKSIIEIDYRLARSVSARSNSSLSLVCACLINHEVAHYLSWQNESRLKNRDAELAADHFAGWIDGLLNQDPSVGASVFYELGCIEKEQCDYPAARLRLAHYLKGHRDGMAGRPHDIVRDHKGNIDQHESASSSVEHQNPSIDLCYFMLRSSALEQTHRFYSALGVDLRKEQHGTGPVHYAATFGTSVLEFYPLTQVNRRIRIGLNVQSIPDSIRRIRSSGFSEAIIRQGTERATLRDPDGNDVELVADF